ncbi:MAG: Gfo/Idh/MocA family protein [Christensenellaceae bacterium]|nr:MAG: gfo/Idh/MocA family oxidoreductase [Clostridiales bacterium]
MNKIFTVAILGCGGRGAESYGRLFLEQKDKYRIVALCDLLPEKLEKYGEIFDVANENRFLTDEEFFEKKRADLLVVSTLDADHVWQCREGLRLGYDVLLEKPVTDKAEECYSLLEAQKKYGGKVLVCHVLRYAGAFRKVGELLDNGAVGRLVEIQALEQVSYWHQAHSYVRGNWRRSEDTTPMILAKCCHDLDLLQYYAKSTCKSVSSVGDLTYFTAKNAPDGAAKRCLDCKYQDSCPYSAKTIYIENWKNRGCPENDWPYNILTLKLPLTEKALTEAVKNGPYGRCVFACDNDVVDHQQVSMTFENGVKATLTMTAFTAGGGRIMRFFGTLGEVVLDEARDVIEVKPFGKPAEEIKIGTLTESGYGHGGGDSGLVRELYEILCGNASPATALEASVESHLMGICAEKSRLEGGRLVSVHDEKE